MVAIDTHYYGKQVIAPLNIVLYNVFGQGGPDLYGISIFLFIILVTRNYLFIVILKGLLYLFYFFQIV